MAEKIQGETWAERLTLSIGSRVRGRRQELRLTLEELARRVSTDVGYPISALAINNFELGRVKGTDLAFLYAIAAGLDCSPLLLIHDPLVQESEVEVLPQVFAPGWTAISLTRGDPQATAYVYSKLPNATTLAPRLERDSRALELRVKFNEEFSELSALKAEISEVVIRGAIDGASEKDLSTLEHLRASCAQRDVRLQNLAAALAEVGVDVEFAPLAAAQLPLDLSHGALATAKRMSSAESD